MGGGMIGARSQTSSVDEDDGPEALLLASAQLPGEGERMLGLVVIIAQRGRQRHAFSSVDLRWAGVAGQAL
jgi:hypothetical protein